MIVKFSLNKTRASQRLTGQIKNELKAEEDLEVEITKVSKLEGIEVKGRLEFQRSQ